MGKVTRRRTLRGGDFRVSNRACELCLPNKALGLTIGRRACSEKKRWIPSHLRPLISIVVWNSIWWNSLRVTFRAGRTGRCPVLIPNLGGTRILATQRNDNLLWDSRPTGKSTVRIRPATNSDLKAIRREREYYNWDKKIHTKCLEDHARREKNIWRFICEIYEVDLQKYELYIKQINA